MNQGRFSASSSTQRKGAKPGEFSHILINYSGPSFSDLPLDIIVNFLRRLTVKRIFVCKLVCKTWHDLISKPEFAKLHFQEAQAYPLAQISGSTACSRMLYLVQPEEENFELKLEMCDHSEYNSKCDCHVKFKLDTKFKLPLRNFQMECDHKDRRPNLRHRKESNDFTRLKMTDHGFRIVNSCNGLLCLSSPSTNEPRVVCNPITGEFVNLPEVKKVRSHGYMFCGFGFSPASNQYKVVRIFKGLNLGSVMWAEVQTLGTETWKEVEVSAKAMSMFYFSPTYVNGFLYWDYRNYSANPGHLISFDMENECFGSISAPTYENSRLPKHVNVGVLGGELCVSCFFASKAIEVWVLRNYGTRNEWSKVVSIHLDEDEICRLGPCRPIKYMNGGALLMYDLATYSLIYKHPRKPGFRYFEFCRRKAADIKAHIPSFVSLKDALSGDNVKVLNVYSRCGNLKIVNEDALISIVEKDKCKIRLRWMNLQVQD